MLLFPLGMAGSLAPLGSSREKVAAPGKGAGPHLALAGIGDRTQTSGFPIVFLLKHHMSPYTIAFLAFGPEEAASVGVCRHLWVSLGCKPLQLQARIHEERETLGASC